MSPCKSSRSISILLAITLAACADSAAPVGVDAGSRVDGGDADAGGLDAGAADSGAADSGEAADSGPPDSGLADSGADTTDAGTTDAGALDGGVTFHYDCGAFSADPGWTVRAGYRAVVVADATAGLNQPVALTFAEGGFGGRLFVVCQGDGTVREVDVATGAVTVAVGGTGWGTPSPAALTTITWDAEGIFDGNLYVGDQGGDGDADSRIYRIAPGGVASLFAMAPGAGMDDIYGLAFAPSAGVYASGLYVTGDTDGAGVDWGIVSATATIATFSEVAGTEGIAFDPTGLYGDALIASRPLGGGYAGDGTITPITTAGAAGTPLATALGGVHAVTFSNGGSFGRSMYAASWSAGTLMQISPTGDITELASGLTLTNYDGNVLAVSSDGQVMFVADRSANRIVCIEPVATP